MKSYDVTASIIVKKQNVLIAKRALGEKYAGYWEFPGGKVEPNEAPEVCLERELYEEIGVVTRVKEFFMESNYTYPTGAIRLLSYLVDIVSGTINLSVHSDYKWVKINHLERYNLLPADIPIAEKLKEGYVCIGVYF